MAPSTARLTASGAASWVAHATWQEGGKRRQSKRTFGTKKVAQAALTELLAAHQSGTFVEPNRVTLAEFVERWLAGLRWSDIQLDRHRLTVNQVATVEAGLETVDVPKTRRSRRVIDLDGDTTALLARHRARQRELLLRLGVTASAADRVFTNEIGDPIRPHSVGQAFGPPGGRSAGDVGRVAPESFPRPAPHPRVSLAHGLWSRSDQLASGCSVGTLEVVTLAEI